MKLKAVKNNDNKPRRGIWMILIMPIAVLIALSGMVTGGDNLASAASFLWHVPYADEQLCSELF